MKIAFFPEPVESFTGLTLEERPLGGIETAVIRLAAALHELGHQVTVFSDHPNPPLTQPLYLPKNALPHLGTVDFFIAVRDWRGAMLPVKTRKLLYWTGDSYDLPQNLGMGDQRVIQRIDCFLAVSSWQAEKICGFSGFPKDKTYILRNGIHTPYFSGTEKRNLKRLIYSSAPYRGLKFLPAIFKTLKEKHKELELHIFSDYKREQAAGAMAPLAQEYNLLKEEFAKLDGCHLHGTVTQKELAAEMMKSAILAYPNIFEETSCITAMEAQAAGCAVVSSAIGALPETLEDSALLIHAKPGSTEYTAGFVDAVDKLLSDPELLQKYSAMGLERSRNFSWLEIAKRFESELLASF